MQTTPAAGSISQIVTEVGTVVTGAAGWITTFVGAITSNPLILMFVIVTFVGIGVGLIRRLMRL